MPTSKKVFSGSLVLAYLLVGSGHFVATSSKQNATRDLSDFAASIPRKVYRYSVVPGGITSPEELAEARKNDPVVAAHFADFGTNTHLEALKEDMFVYVSYRVGNQVFYTKKKHKVCKGEVVITDGKNFARTRCANRLSKVFRPPALAFDEPTTPQFDYIDPPSSPDVIPGDPLLTSNYYGLPEGAGTPPVLPAQTGATPVPSVTTPFTSGVITPQPTPFGVPGPGLFPPPSVLPPTPSPTPTPTPTPTPVPEPTELGFAACAVSVLILFLRNKNRRTS